MIVLFYRVPLYISDINECQHGSHDCNPTSQRCDNTIGSYQCVRFTSCGTGYTLNAASGLCEGSVTIITIFVGNYIKIIL